MDACGAHEQEHTDIGRGGKDESRAVTFIGDWGQGAWDRMDRMHFVSLSSFATGLAKHELGKA